MTLKEVIKSAGWELVWSEKEDTYQKEEWILTHRISNNRIQINRGQAVYFRGKVENESEFKILMKMLGV